MEKTQNIDGGTPKYSGFSHLSKVTIRDRAPIRKPARIVTLYFTTYLRKHLMTNIYISKVNSYPTFSQTACISKTLDITH